MFILGDKPAKLTHEEVFETSSKRHAGRRSSATTRSGSPSTTSRRTAPSPTCRWSPPRSAHRPSASASARPAWLRRSTTRSTSPSRSRWSTRLTGGRFDAGFGRGYQAHEFRGFGVPMDEATARFQECVTIVEGLLTQEQLQLRGSVLDDRRPHDPPAPGAAAGTDLEHGDEDARRASSGWPRRATARSSATRTRSTPDLATGPRALPRLTQPARTCRRRPMACGRCSTCSSTPTTGSPGRIPARASSCRSRYHRQYSNPFERGGEIPADYKAYADWFDKHDDQSYEQILDSHLTLMGDPDRTIEKMRRSSTWAGRTSCSA